VKGLRDSSFSQGQSPMSLVCCMPIELVNLFQIQSPEGVAGEAVKLWQCKEDTLVGD